VKALLADVGEWRAVRANGTRLGELGRPVLGGRKKASDRARLLTFGDPTRGWWFRGWPAPRALMRAVLGLAMAE
jgi:hypothetical protein